MAPPRPRAAPPFPAMSRSRIRRGPRRRGSRRHSVAPITCWWRPSAGRGRRRRPWAWRARPTGQLRDCDHGSWAGRSLAEIQAEAPEALAAWLSDPAANPHGGESIADLIRRVAAWCDSPERGEGRVLAITHPAVMRAALVHALGAGADGLLADRRRTALPPDPVAPGRHLAAAGAGEARLPRIAPAALRARQAPAASVSRTHAAFSSV